MPERRMARLQLRPRRGPRGAAALACLAVLGLLCAGCMTRTVQEKLVEQDGVQVFARHRIERGMRVERGLAQPATVSPQRLAYILGAIDVETRTGKGKGREVRRAIHPDILWPVAQALATAFEQADSSQQLAVMAVRKERRLGLFHRKYLTSFVAWIDGERLVIDLSRVDWPIPKKREDDRLPEPRIGEKQMDFRVVAARHMSPVGARRLAIRWRDPLFSQPVRSESAVAGPDQRRTILMDSPIPQQPLDRSRLGGVDPDTLRALADLEEARRAGSITETEYRDRRENLLGRRGD